MWCQQHALKAYSFYNPEPNDSKLGMEHLENLFLASSSEPKDHLTQNLVGSIGVTCRCPGSHLENIFCTSPELKDQMT